MKKNSTAVWLLFFSLTLLLLTHYSQHLLFWNDEGFAAMTALDTPWSAYLHGETYEGNSAPLYFLILKALLWVIASLSKFSFDPAYVLRLFIAIIPTSIFVADVSYRGWLVRKEHRLFWAICFALTVTSTSAVLGYGWQARHYGIWLCLSWFFMCAVWQKESPAKILLTSCALALTTPFSFFQIGAGLLLLCVDRKRPFYFNWRSGLVLIPSLILSALYLAQAKKEYLFVWPELPGFVPLITASVKYWVVIPILIFLYLLRRNPIFFKSIIFIALNLALTLSVLLSFFLHRTNQGFEISNRYFIYLLPSVFLLFWVLLKELSIQNKPRVNRMLISIGIVMVGISGFKIYQDWTKIPKSPPQQRIKAKLQRASLDHPGICFCIDQNQPGLPTLNLWGGLALELIRHNSNLTDCTFNKLHISEATKGISLHNTKTAARSNNLASCVE